MSIDIEGLRPQAIDLMNGLDNANKDGLANDMKVAEVVAAIHLLM